MRVRGRKREKRENQILQFSLGRFALSPHNCSDTLSNDPVFLGRYPLLYFSHTLFEEFSLGQEESVDDLTLKKGKIYLKKIKRSCENQANCGGEYPQRPLPRFPFGDLSQRPTG